MRVVQAQMQVPVLRQDGWLAGRPLDTRLCDLFNTHAEISLLHFVMLVLLKNPTSGLTEFNLTINNKRGSSE